MKRGRLERAAGILALTLSVGYWVISIAALALGARPGMSSSIDVSIAPVLAFGGYAVVGGLLASRRPRNSIGWLLLVVSLGVGFIFLADQLALIGLITAPGSIPLAEFAAWLSVWLFLPSLMSLIFVLFLFPTGRLPSPRWRPVVSVIAVCFLGVVLLYAFGTRGSAAHPEVLNPYFIPSLGPLKEAVEAAFWVYLMVLGLGVASLVARYRRGSRTEKQQLKWIVMAAAFMVPCILSASFVPAVISWPLAVSALPIAIGIAVLRHRLFDIDLLIKRTLVYGATTAAIAAVFFIGIVALQTVLRPLTAGSELAIAASTLVSFALFQPVRRRIRDLVDHRFDRSRYEAAGILEVFADRLRNEVELEALRTELLDAVQQTMLPAHASFWLRERPH